MSYSIFPFRLDYSTNISIRWNNAQLPHELSPAPLGFSDGVQTARKRTFSVSAKVKTGAHVDALEAFFAGIGCDPFWLPDLPREISAFTQLSDTLLEVDGFDLTAFVEQQNAYALIFRSYGSADPVIAEVESIERVGGKDRITFAEAHPGLPTPNEAEICFSSLVVVDSDSIKLVPITSDYWRVSFSAVEQPFDPEPSRQVFYCYEFTCTDHLGNSRVHRHTTDADARDLGGETYTPHDIMHSGLEHGVLSKDNRCTISLRAVPDGVFATWKPFAIEPPVRVTLNRVEIVDGVEQTAVEEFSGECAQIMRQGDLIEATFRSDALNQKIPNFLVSTRDNSNPWDNHDPDLFTLSATVITVEVDRLFVTFDDDENVSELEGGHLVIETDGLAVVRDIISVSLVGGELYQLRINYSVEGVAVDDTFTCYYGYDGSPETYKRLFGDLEGFGGHPMLPESNPSLNAISISSGGGKK